MKILNYKEICTNQVPHESQEQSKQKFRGYIVQVVQYGGIYELQLFEVIDKLKFAVPLIQGIKAESSERLTDIVNLFHKIN